MKMPRPINGAFEFAFDFLSTKRQTSPLRTSLQTPQTVFPASIVRWRARSTSRTSYILAKGCVHPDDPQRTLSPRRIFARQSTDWLRRGTNVRGWCVPWSLAADTQDLVPPRPFDIRA